MDATLKDIILLVCNILSVIIGTIAGISKASKILDYRVNQCEESIEKHEKEIIKIPVMENEIQHLKEHVIKKGV